MNNRHNFYNLTTSADRVLESIFSPFWIDAHVNGTHQRQGCKCLATNVKDNDDNIIVTAEVPGLTEDQVSISMEDGVLTIKGEYGEEGDNFFRTGTWSKSYRAENIDVENVKAALNAGILTITLPKAEAVKPKQIAISVG